MVLFYAKISLSVFKKGEGGPEAPGTLRSRNKKATASVASSYSENPPVSLRTQDSLAAVRPQAEEGESAMDVTADGDGTVHGGGRGRVGKGKRKQKGKSKARIQDGLRTCGPRKSRSGKKRPSGRRGRARERGVTRRRRRWSA